MLSPSSAIYFLLEIQESLRQLFFLWQSVVHLNVILDKTVGVTSSFCVLFLARRGVETTYPPCAVILLSCLQLRLLVTGPSAFLYLLCSFGFLSASSLVFMQVVDVETEKICYVSLQRRRYSWDHEWYNEPTWRDFPRFHASSPIVSQVILKLFRNIGIKAFMTIFVNCAIHKC